MVRGDGWWRGGGCLRYVNSLPLQKKLCTALPLLFRSFSEDLVLAAFELMKGGASADKDGFLPEVYQQFPDVFVPHMFSTMQHFLRNGRVSDVWSVSVMTSIPKFAQASKAKDMRRIALQNAVMEWMSFVILLQLQDVFAQIIPPSQKGFMKGRQMLEHEPLLSLSSSQRLVLWAALKA